MNRDLTVAAVAEEEIVLPAVFVIPLATIPGAILAVPVVVPVVVVATTDLVKLTTVNFKIVMLSLRRVWLCSSTGVAILFVLHLKERLL